MTKYRFQVFIERDDDGAYISDVPALQGCLTHCDTIEEALHNIREVTAMCIEEIQIEKPKYRRVGFFAVRNNIEDDTQ